LTVFWGKGTWFWSNLKRGRTAGYGPRTQRAKRFKVSLVGGEKSACPNCRVRKLNKPFPEGIPLRSSVGEETKSNGQRDYETTNTKRGGRGEGTRKSG